LENSNGSTVNLRAQSRPATSARWLRESGGFLRSALTITAKDIRIELRTRELLSSMFVFALVVSVLFSYTLDLKPTQVNDIAAGLLWLIFAFAGILGLNRVFVAESESGTLQGLLVAPIDRAALYLGKWFSTVLFIVVAQIINVPVFAVFANLPFQNLPGLFPVLVLGSLGFAAVGVMFSAIAANTRMREVMLPVLLLPLATPVLLAAIELTSAALANQPFETVRHWWSLLIAYDVIFLTVGLLTFEAITQDD
jgi:heme exporter protein B